MNKKLLLSSVAGLLSVQLLAQELPTTTDANAQMKAAAQLKLQNREIIKMVEQRLGKDLPKAIDKYTTLESIKSEDLTLFYNFTIKSDKNDEQIKKEDTKRMKTFVTKGICKTSQRFLESDINITYIYNSFKTKNELFKFDISKKDCFYIWGGRDKLPSS